MAIYPKNDDRCIFWSATGKRCTSASDGLFIPNESHITACCTTTQYVLCERYRRGQQQQRKKAEAKLTANRRKHLRTPVRYPVLLRYVNPPEKAFRNRSTMADTIDLSDGGMQITSRKPLLPDTLVHIIYNQAASHGALKELALVRWCYYREDRLRYLSGLSFHSRATGSDRPLYSSIPQPASKKAKWK